MPGKREEILDIAEKMIRDGGYNSFSFRDIATEAGIKSASVHYHFPTKEELGVAVSERYMHRFLEMLGDADDPGKDWQEKVGWYIELFRRAFIASGRPCLCGILMLEYGKLPGVVQEVMNVFVEKNIDWLKFALDSDSSSNSSQGKAEMIFAAFEGALAIATVKSDAEPINRIENALFQLVEA